MRRFPLLLLCLSALLLGCRPDREKPSSPPDAIARLGKPLQGLSVTPLSEILDHPEQFNERTVAVEGHVARACTRKGCWMEVATSKADTARACRVTFEDYAFFVPKDSPGAHARLEGKVAVSRVKPSHVEHLEAEGAKFSSKNADGSALEIQIVATGVELARDAGARASL
jgi:hypothetical protein